MNQHRNFMARALHKLVRYKSLLKRLQFRRTWRLVWRSAPLWTMVNGIFVLIEGLLPLLSLYLLKLIIDAFVEGLGGQSPEAFHTAAWLIGALAAVSAVAAVFKVCGRLVMEAHIDAVNDHIQTMVQKKAIEVDLEDYESPEYHDLLQQVQTQATFRPARIARGVFIGARSLVTGTALAAFLFSFSWVLGIILILFALPGVLVRLKYAHVLLDWHGRQSSLRRFTAYLHNLVMGSASAKELRLFGLGRVLNDRARAQRKTLRTEKLRIESRRAMLELIPNLCSVAALFLTFWIVARQAIKGLISIGDIVIYYQAFQRCQNALSEFLSIMVNFYEDSLFLGLLYRFMDLQPKVKSPEHPRKVPGKLKAGFVIENLNFRYPGTDRDILHDISLTIEPGEVMALVGENGAGKTTLAKLLCRLYDPTKGRILLDGIDIREFDVENYRRMVGAVFQDFNQYNLTARENIWFGNVLNPHDDPAIIKSAENASIHETITRLGNGYETILGREFRAGEQLSAGQWQRVALARALYRKSQILILDEPTSAMDPKAESELYQTIRNLTTGKTTLLISHRLSTVTMSDRICVLDQGRILESGPHRELQARRGLYADLFERQSRAYR